MNVPSSILALSLALSGLTGQAHAQSAFDQLRRGVGSLGGSSDSGVPSIGRVREFTGLPVARPGGGGGVLQQISDEVSGLYKKVAPAVVMIEISGDEQVLKAVAMKEAEEQVDKQLAEKKLMEEFQGWAKAHGKPDLASVDKMGTGSGFVIDPRGLILTNDHVVKYSALGARISVQFVNGESAPAKVLWMSEDDDLALIKVDVGFLLPSVPLGDSSRVEIGQVACALGNPLGLESVFTCGTITALNPKLGIQHDAPITNGNSGGPLINANGEVIGINYMVIKGDGGGVEPGMGFAIPIDLVKQKAAQRLAPSR